MPAASPAESAPPAKRKPSSPKPRGTEHLDLSAAVADSELMNGQKRQLDILMKLLRKKKKIVVIAGAGISVGAGSMFPLKFLTFG
jgi:NAD-dependent histone deacetylase SIR2